MIVKSMRTLKKSYLFVRKLAGRRAGRLPFGTEVPTAGGGPRARLGNKASHGYLIWPLIGRAVKLQYWYDHAAFIASPLLYLTLLSRSASAALSGSFHILFLNQTSPRL